MRRTPWHNEHSNTRHALFITVLLVLAFVGSVNRCYADNDAPTQQHTPSTPRTDSSEGTSTITCSTVVVTDGDTFRCNGTRIRLAHIDAPELPGHCRPGRSCTPGDPFASKAYLRSLTSHPVTCRAIDTDKYGRTVAFCKSNGKDLSCAMVQSKHAVQRYGALDCSK